MGLIGVNFEYLSWDRGSLAYVRLGACIGARVRGVFGGRVVEFQWGLLARGLLVFVIVCRASI